MNIVEKIVISLVYLLIGHVLIIGNTKDLESNFETFIFTSFLLFLVYKTLELLYNFFYLFIKLLKDEEKDKFEIIKFSFYLILIISF